MLIFLIFLSSVYANQECILQVCDLNNTIGLTCPPDMECSNIEEGFGRCCYPLKAVVTTNLSKQKVCVDLLNKQTGQSDCPSRSYLCEDRRYYDLMTIQCPKTCNRCDKSKDFKEFRRGCEDKKNPKTGRSDCTATAHLCNSPLYKNVMREQCPKTCKLC